MKCKKCNNKSVKNGKQSGIQRYHCKSCKYSFQAEYKYSSYSVEDKRIKVLLINGCGIRSISRILEISPTTVITRIKRIAREIQKPNFIPIGKEYQIDELATYLGEKKRRIWITYALQNDNRAIIDFAVGSRSLKVMKPVTETVVLSQPKQIFTDKYINYKTLIPEEMHTTKHRCINYIERMNLTLRIHLKRLNRRTICYSKSMVMLTACLKIYFWG